MNEDFEVPRDEMGGRLQEGFAAQERERAEVEAEAARHPAPASLLPDATPADLLASNLIKALRRQAEFLDLPLDPADPRVGRLIAEVANQTVNAVVRAQEKSLAAKRDDEHDRAMEALFEERMKKAQLEIDRVNAAGPSPFSYKPGLSGHRFSKG